MARRVRVYVAAVAALAVAVAAAGDATTAAGPPTPWWSLALFAPLLVLAESLIVRFRYRGEVDALNPLEAVLAPVLVGFPVPVVALLVGGTQLVAGAVRRNRPLKVAFNAAQWTLAAALGGHVLRALADGPGVDARNVAALVVSLAVVGLANQTLFTVVLWLADPHPVRNLLQGLAPVMRVGWLASWALNSVVGLLFTFAFAGWPPSVATFVLPLLVLHAGYRAYAGMRSDRVRLAGLHEAAQVLAGPLDPADAFAEYLAVVSGCFEARGAELVLPGASGVPLVHRVTGGDAATYTVEQFDPMVPSLHTGLVARGGGTRVLADDPDLGPLLVARGWRDALAAPLSTDGQPPGVLVVYDQSGLEGSEAGERAVIESLAREAGAILRRGALVADVLEERRKLAQIVGNTSDGIFMLGPDGTVRSWNPGIEAVTGLPATQMVGASINALRTYDAAGDVVPLAMWSAGIELPEELAVVAAGDETRWLSCSYSVTGEQRSAALVVVARDTTKAREVERLRRECGRIAAREAVQREFVHQLQEAVRPAIPDVDGVELAVSYLPSDPSAPTGGDLYDWLPLPDGTLHLAVVDAQGKGVAATKEALAVVHALRVLALEGLPVEDLVARADRVVVAQFPNLAATVLVGRYDPASARLRLAGGGHPPVLLVRATGAVDEIEAPGTAIGWPGAGSLDPVDVELDPGDLVVLYTDGLVEANKDIVEGIATLAAAAADARSLPAGDLASSVVARCLAGAARHDDSLALVVRRDPRPSPWRFREELDDPADLARLRRRLRAWLDREGVVRDANDDVVLATSELVTNALVAGAARVEVRLAASGGEMVLEVHDDGPGFPDAVVTPPSCPEPGAPEGRGLWIVQSVLDDVELASTRSGVVVRGRKGIHRDGGPGR